MVRGDVESPIVLNFGFNDMNAITKDQLVFMIELVDQIF